MKREDTPRVKTTGRGFGYPRHTLEVFVVPVTSVVVVESVDGDEGRAEAG